MITDSGNRREFESGAVRDMAEGKGRCDLLPLGEIGDWFETLIGIDNGDDIAYVLRLFSDMIRENNYEKQSGAVRSLLNYAASKMFSDRYTMILEVAVHYEEGAKKYDERNWEKGIPLWCFVDSGVRHYLKWLRGDTDERHDRAFVWNVLGYIYTLNTLTFEVHNED